MEKLLKKSEIPDDLLEYFEEVTPPNCALYGVGYFWGCDDKRHSLI